MAPSSGFVWRARHFRRAHGLPVNRHQIGERSTYLDADTHTRSRFPTVVLARPILSLKMPIRPPCADRSTESVPAHPAHGAGRDGQELPRAPPPSDWSILGIGNKEDETPFSRHRTAVADSDPSGTEGAESICGSQASCPSSCALCELSNRLLPPGEDIGGQLSGGRVDSPALFHALPGPAQMVVAPREFFDCLGGKW